MNNKVITKEAYEELSGYLEYYASKCNQQEEEMRYMYDFLCWMHLEGMYDNFRKKAHLVEPEDGGFSYYAMDDERNSSEIFS